MLASKRTRVTKDPKGELLDVQHDADAEMDREEPAILAVLFEKSATGGSSLAVAFLSRASLSVCLLPCSSEHDLVYTIDTNLDLPFPPTAVFCNSQLPDAAKRLNPAAFSSGGTPVPPPAPEKPGRRRGVGH